MKGKYVETKFEKSSVILQLNAFKSKRQSILGVISTTSVSKPQLKSKKLEDKFMHNNSQGKKQQVEDHRRSFKVSNNKTTKQPIVLPISTRKPKRTVNQSVATPLKKLVVAESTNQKPKSKIKNQYEHVSKTCRWWYSKITPLGYKWKPKTSTVNVTPNVSMPLGNKSRTTNISESIKLRGSTLSNTPLSSNSFAARRDNLFIVDAGCSKHMTGNLKLLSNFVEKFLGTVKFGNDQIAPILGYGDLLQGNVTIKRVYYVERLNYNLFFVGKFCDVYLEVAFRKSTCYIRDLKGNDLLTSSRGTDLYSISFQDTSTPNPVCLIAKASSDGENLNKIKEKGDACIFVGYSTQSRAYRVYNKRKRVIVETIHVNFNELPLMASDHVRSDPVLQCPTMALEQVSLSPGPQSQENVPQVAETVTTSNELYFLFSLMFDELLNGTTPVVSKSSTVTAADTPDQRQQHNTTPSNSTTVAADTPPLNIQTKHEYTSQALTQAPTVTSTKNINQAETQKENAQVEEDEFINIFSTLHGITSCDSIGTPMATKPLDADLSGTPVDQMKYRSMVGALMYLTASRPNIVHATCYCACYQARPTEKHLKEVKWIFRYLKNIINMGLWYPKDIGFELTAFLDSDHAGCLDSRGDKLVSWSSKKQDCTSMSSAEAEYVSLSAYYTQVLCIRTQLTDYGFHLDKIRIYYDSQEAIAISCNPIQHSRTKHIDVRYHFIKEYVKKGIVELFFVGTEYQLADLFTKSLLEDRFKYLARRLGGSQLEPPITKTKVHKSSLEPEEIKLQISLGHNPCITLVVHQYTTFGIKESYALSLRSRQNIRVILFSIHSDNGNHSSVNIKQYCGRYKRRCCNLVPAKSDSLPHAHTQAFKVNHSTSRLLILNFLIVKELKVK
ncbi:hypothetical protein Tco_0439454 [Tanacetum coccineum]